MKYLVKLERTERTEMYMILDAHDATEAIDAANDLHGKSGVEITMAVPLNKWKTKSDQRDC